MARDRWRDDDGESSTAPAEKDRSSGINPSSFYKKHGSEQPSTTEKKLDNILQMAARNEVVQKRHKFTEVQNTKRDAYHEVTSLKVFPLQDFAMEYLVEMMNEHLGNANTVLHIRLPKNELCDCDDDQHELSLNNDFKRRKLDMDDRRIKYTTRFLAERYYLPVIDKCRNDKDTVNDNDGQCQHVMEKYRFLPELWSMEPRIFAQETASTGKRKYIVGNLGRFLQHYWRECGPRSRHFYELIPEGTPCRLYFDLEFSKNANHQITFDESELLMTEFIEEICIEFEMIYDIQINRSCIVDLDSSTEKKFSRHLIIHLPNGELFANSCSAGVFVKRLVGRLAEELSTGVLEGRRSTLAKYLFVHKHAPKTTEPESLESKETTERKIGFDNKNLSCFVDLGVYTRNRLFRLMGSIKFGKHASAALRIAKENKFANFPAGFDNSKFYLTGSNISCNPDPTQSQIQPSISHGTSYEQIQDHESFCAALDWESHARALSLTLVVPANASKINTLILKESNDDGQDPIKASNSFVARRQKPSPRSSSGDSPIPKLDSFILSINTSGIQGKIRAWSMEGSSVSYQMSGNRWCANIGRPHKGNNIIWNIDLKSNKYWQTCHDPECRGANFRGSTMHLPEDVATAVSDYLLDQELAAIDEDKIISEAREDFGDSQLDDELGNLDMSLFRR